MTKFIQDTMDAAYKRWQKPENKNWTQVQFWAQLSEMEKVAVFVGNYNYQVENGGHLQYHGNRFATQENIRFLMRLCDAMDTESSRRVKQILRKFKSLAAELDEDLDNFKYMHEDLDNLDTMYYRIKDRFLDDVNNYMILTFGKNT